VGDGGGGSGGGGRGGKGGRRGGGGGGGGGGGTSQESQEKCVEWPCCAFLFLADGKMAETEEEETREGMETGRKEGRKGRG